jgi:copper homeostasis protein
MVRLRPGTFVCTPSEVDVMQSEIDGLKRSRVEGIVLGVLTADSRIDVEATARLAAVARPMSVTFHRAFDEVRDQAQALEDLVSLGIDRVLTSGGARDAHAGRAAIRDLVVRARGRIVVMAGGGVRPHNAAAILADTGVQEIHGSVPFQVPGRNPAGGVKLPGRSG